MLLIPLHYLAQMARAGRGVASLVKYIVVDLTHTYPLLTFKFSPHTDQPIFVLPLTVPFSAMKPSFFSP